MNLINYHMGTPTTHPFIHPTILPIIVGYQLNRLKRYIWTGQTDSLLMEFKGWWGIWVGYQENEMQCDICHDRSHLGHLVGDLI